MKISIKNPSIILEQKDLPIFPGIGEPSETLPTGMLPARDYPSDAVVEQLKQYAEEQWQRFNRREITPDQFNKLVMRKSDELILKHKKTQPKQSSLTTATPTIPKNLNYGYVFGTIDGEILSQHNATKQIYGASMNKPILALANLVLNKDDPARQLGHGELTGLLSYTGKDSNHINMALSNRGPSRHVKAQGDKKWIINNASRIGITKEQTANFLEDLGLRDVISGIRYGGKPNNKQSALGVFRFLSFLLKPEKHDFLKKYNEEANKILKHMKREMGVSFGSDRESRGIQNLQNDLNTIYGENHINTIYGKGGYNQSPTALNYGLVINNKYILVIYTTSKDIKNYGRPGGWNPLLNVALTALKPMGWTIQKIPQGRHQLPRNRRRTGRTRPISRLVQAQSWPGQLIVQNPKRAWATPKMKDFLDGIRFLGPWYVGDISIKSGKAFGSHVSHRDGMNVDIAYPLTDGGASIQVNSAGEWVRKTGNIFKAAGAAAIDKRRLIQLLVAALKYGATWIGTDRSIITVLKPYARKHLALNVYKKLFSVLSHWDNHKSHVHIRLGGGQRASRHADAEFIAAQSACLQKKWPDKEGEFPVITDKEGNILQRPENFNFKTFYEDLDDLLGEHFCALSKHKMSGAEGVLKELGGTPNYVFDEVHYTIYIKLPEIRAELQQRVGAPVKLGSPRWKELQNKIDTYIQQTGKGKPIGIDAPVLRELKKRKQINIKLNTILNNAPLPSNETIYRDILMEKEMIKKKTQPKKINKQLIKEAIKIALLEGPTGTGGGPTPAGRGPSPAGSTPKWNPKTKIIIGQNRLANLLFRGLYWMFANAKNRDRILSLAQHGTGHYAKHLVQHIDTTQLIFAILWKWPIFIGSSEALWYWMEKEPDSAYRTWTQIITHAISPIRWAVMVYDLVGHTRAGTVDEYLAGDAEARRLDAEMRAQVSGIKPECAYGNEGLSEKQRIKKLRTCMNSSIQLMTTTSAVVRRYAKHIEIGAPGTENIFGPTKTWVMHTDCSLKKTRAKKTACQELKTLYRTLRSVQDCGATMSVAEWDQKYPKGSKYRNIIDLHIKNAKIIPGEEGENGQLINCPLLDVQHKKFLYLLIYGVDPDKGFQDPSAPAPDTGE